MSSEPDIAESDWMEASDSQLDRYIDGSLERVTDLVDTITREQEDTLASAIVLDLRQHTPALEHAIERLPSCTMPRICRMQENNMLPSPVQCLPPELLSYIFVLAVPDLWFRAPSGGMTLPFASVCSEWRAIALSTPQLWSYIAISSRQPWDEGRRTTIRSRQDNDTLMSIANAYIARSAGAPLTVVWATHSVDLWYQRRKIDHLQRLNVCKRLLQESARWKSAKMECSIESFSCWTRVPFPLLESLDFGADEDSVDGNNMISFFSEAPLRRLTIRGDILPLRQPVQWPKAWRISCLHLDDVSTCHIVGALTAFAPHLEDVKVRNNGTCGTSRAACPFATLPKLHTMEISGGAMPAMRLQAPALTRLVLSDGIWPPIGADDLYHLAAFLALDSHSCLIHLKLNNITGTADRLVSLLPAIPTLTCLWISARYTGADDPYSDLITPMLVKRLTRVQSSPASLTLLPRLKALALFAKGRYSPEIDGPALDMLRSRVNAMEYDGLELQPLLALQSDISSVRAKL